MSPPAIRLENLSKEYALGAPAQRYRTLRETLSDWVAAPFRRFPKGNTSRHGTPHIWALREVSFDVQPGEVVGIVGRNGAGKSTLLKVLSRITEPTSGRAVLHGRVGSLLEVGTGFHPELTGRENIALNGAILGMSRAEIRRKFDAIVAFAEIDQFLDTPVKRYSSGMYVRLAFAVAAHLEPEILVVDEVLSVGDSAFQKKCLGKMDDVAKGGRTVLFVSHQMNQIRRLCARCAWLDGGQLRLVGPTAETVAAYEAAACERGNPEEHRLSNQGRAARFCGWEILEPPADRPNHLTSFGPLALRFRLEINRPVANGHHGIALFNMEGQLLWGTEANRLAFGPGIHELVYRLPSLPLRPGSYSWRVSLYDESGVLDVLDCLPELIVATEPQAHSRDQWAGLLNLPYQFTVTTGA